MEAQDSFKLTSTSYDGPAIERTQDGNILVHNKGRIIIDTESFSKQPYQCKVYTVPLSSRVKAAVATSDNDDADEAEDELDPYWYPPSEFGNERNTMLSVKEKADAAPTTLSDYHHMLCTPILRGYSLKTKKWRTSASGPTLT